MPKSRFVQIDIPTPCSQSWDEMTTSGNGRFCGECQKTVIDFTTWSDSQLYKFFAKNTDHVCGRYLSTQVARPIYIPHQPHSRLYKMTIALGLTLLFTQTPQLLAQIRPPKIAQTDNTTKAKPIEPGFRKISGRVLDDTKQPLPSAVVQVSQNNVVKGGAVTDIDGNYIVSPLAPGYYDVMVIYVGLDTFNVKNVLVSVDKTDTVNVTMKKNSRIGREVTIQGAYGIPLVDPDKHMLTREEMNRIPELPEGMLPMLEPITIPTGIPAKKPVSTTPPGTTIFTREEINHSAAK